MLLLHAVAAALGEGTLRQERGPRAGPRIVGEDDKVEEPSPDLRRGAAAKVDATMKIITT